MLDLNHEESYFTTSKRQTAIKFYYKLKYHLISYTNTPPKEYNMNKKIKTNILHYISQPIPKDSNIVQHSIPVVFFGDIEKAKFATISINPSDKEFYTNYKQYKEPRIINRQNLSKMDFDKLSVEDASKVYTSLINYFSTNPYRGWFNHLERFLSPLFNTSYYNGTMINLDICPWTTQKKWRNLSKHEKTNMLRNYNLLCDILNTNKYDAIFINGRHVKETLEQYLNITIPSCCDTTVGKYTYQIYYYKYQNTIFIGSSAYINNLRVSTTELKKLQDLLSTILTSKN